MSESRSNEAALARELSHTRPAMPLLKKFSDLLARLCRIVIAASTVVMIGFLFVQVLLRYLFSAGFPWAEELAITLCAWIVLLGAGLGVKEGFHVRLTVLLDVLPTRALPFLEGAIQLVCLGFGIGLAYSGYVLTRQSEGMYLATMHVPIGVLYTVTIVSGITIAFFAFENIVSGNPPKVSEDANV